MHSLAQNEQRDIVEWIEYHSIIGVDRFYIVDNESNDNTTHVLEKYVESGKVVLLSWPYEINVNQGQPSAATYAMYYSKGQVEWMMNTDMDVFLLPGKALYLKFND